MEIDAELFAGHMRDYLAMAGVDTTGISSYDLGVSSVRILKEIADQTPHHAQADS